MIFFYLITFIALIAETVFLPYPFTLLIIIMAVLALGPEALVFAFFTGLVLDILDLRFLGSDSLLFLLIAALMLRYNRRINFTNPLNVMVFIIVSISIYSAFYYRQFINISLLLITIPLSFLLIILLPLIFSGTRSKTKLKL